MIIQDMDRSPPTCPPSTLHAQFPQSPRRRWTDIDPLDDDDVGDELVVTSSRRLLRLAIAATDAGARFTREGVSTDPAAWMLAPRAMFGGRAPIDACQELVSFQRNALLHGLGLDLDADPAALDDLLVDDETSSLPSAEQEVHAPVDRDDTPAFGEEVPPKLLTCWVDTADRGTRLTAFLALSTARPEDLFERVVGRYGREAATTARYAEGFTPAMSPTCLTIGGWLAGLLVDASGDVTAGSTDGIDIVVEQRFAE